MRCPPVSAIVPTWNRAGLVGRAIDSILAQTYRPMEIIVVDDGSTDNTPEVLASYGDSIKVIRQENRGVSAARNAGIRASLGELIAFLDSDDTWWPEKTAVQVEIIEAAGSEVVCCLANSFQHWVAGRVENTFENNGFRPGPPRGILENPVEILLTRFLLFNQNVLVRRASLLKAGLFDEKLHILEDYRLALSMAFEGAWCYTTSQLADIYSHGSPHSLSDVARRDRRVVFRALLVIYDEILSGGCQLTKHQRGLAERGLRRARGQLSRAEGRGRRSTGLLSLAATALWRRSPWFPKPQVRPLTVAVRRE